MSASLSPSVRETTFLQPIYMVFKKRSNYQDRLGTNIGKFENTRRFVQGVRAAVSVRGEVLTLPVVRKTPLFEPFIFKMYLFNKTGSGQT